MNARLRIHPNPAYESIQLLGQGFDPSRAIEVSIMDLTGRSVILQTLPGVGGTLNVSSLPAGFYLIRAAQGDMVRVQRFVKR